MCANLTDGFSCLHVSINYASTTMALTKYACILLQHVLKPLKFPYRNRSFFSARHRFKKEIFSSIIMFRLLTATRSDCVPSIALADDGSGSDNMSARVVSVDRRIAIAVVKFHGLYSATSAAYVL